MNKLCICLFILLGTACHSNPDKTKAVLPKADTGTYYPIADFFREQMEYVDLRNFSIKYSHTINSKKDSAMLSKEEFLKWGNLFLEKSQLFGRNKQLFKESVFQDLSTQSITLNYIPVDHQVDGIQHIDVLLDEDTKKVKRVIIKIITNTADTSITEQYNWSAYKGLQLTRFKTAGNNYSAADVVYINWHK